MRLKLGQLQKIVDNTIAEEKSTDDLREEISRVLGPSVVTNVKLDQLAEGANYRIGVLERTGRENHFKFNDKVMLKFLNSKCTEARLLTARTLSENIVCKMVNDSDMSVRHIVARRSPVSVIKEMIKRSPNDDELRVIYREKRLEEAGGIPTPKSSPMASDVTLKAKRLGDTVKQQNVPEISKQWYETAAYNFIKDYGNNIEGQWQAPLVHRYCSSLRVTSKVNVDEKKLLAAIEKQLKQKDDDALKKYSLKETINYLNNDVEELPVFVEAVNPVKDLLQTTLSPTEYVKQAMTVFNIRESIMPASLRKYRISEGHNGVIMIPCNGSSPSSRVSVLDERALDKFVKNWNSIQEMAGEPICIDWTHNPTSLNGISFNVELK